MVYGGCTLSKKRWRTVANTLFLLIVFSVTFHYIFRGRELSDVIACIHNTKKVFILLGVILALMYISGESVIIQLLLRTVKIKLPLLRCLKYSFVGYFFSAVTPSASGGQPMQIYWMKQDKISVAVSTLILMIVTAAYKTVLLFLCFIFAILQWDDVYLHFHKIWFLVLIGFTCNVLFIIFLLTAIFRRSWLSKSIQRLIYFLGKHHLIKNCKKWMKKANGALQKYNTGTIYLKENSRVFVKVMILTLVQRICLFLVTYMVYLAFGIGNVSVIKILALQTFLALAVDSLPLPGGIGASESSFLVIFLTIFGERYILPGMLLSRGITYYCLMLLSGVITVVSLFITKIKKKNESGGI